MKEMEMKYEKFSGTVGVQEVTYQDFIECWVRLNTVAISNGYTPIINNDYLALKSPLPHRTGYHYTLVYDCGSKNPYEVLLEMYEVYISSYERWAREDERLNILKKIERLLKE